MKTKTKQKLIVGLVLSAFATATFADEKVGTTEDSIGVQAFGNASLTNVRPVQKNPGECLSFEASFSEPLDRKPSAVVDIERHFVNMVNAFLEVTKISGDKYRMALTAKTAEGCPKIEDDSRVTISTYSGEDSADQKGQTIPQAITFTSEKNKLKKE